MTIIFNSLKKSFDKIALLIKLFVEIVFYSRIDFVGNANNRAVTSKIVTNIFGTESFVCENLFTFKLYALDKSKSGLRVVNMPAGQYHFEKLHLLVDNCRHAMTRLLGLSKPNMRSGAPCKKSNPFQARLNYLARRLRV